MLRGIGGLHMGYNFKQGSQGGLTEKVTSEHRLGGDEVITTWVSMGRVL